MKFTVVVLCDRLRSSKQRTPGFLSQAGRTVRGPHNTQFYPSLEESSRIAGPSRNPLGGKATAQRVEIGRFGFRL